jgi:preprotein translocase subunit SecA
MEKLSAGEVKEKTKEFKARLEAGETLDELLPEAFALVRGAISETSLQHQLKLGQKDGDRDDFHLT